MSVEQIIEAALSLPKVARAVLADRLAESLYPAQDAEIKKIWIAEALRRRDEVRSGSVKTISALEALEQARRAVAR